MSCRTLVVIALFALPATAEAQNAAQPGKWTVELYGGLVSGSSSNGGSPLDRFPAGDPFTLQSGEPSRAVPSWFFGDGAALLNQVLAQFAANTGTTFPRIDPLDASLRSSAGRRGSGGAFGLRVGRKLTPKFTVELSVERGTSKMRLRDSLVDQLTETGDSFVHAFETFFSSAPVVNLNVRSTVTTREDRSTPVRLAGALKWTVLTRNRIEAYVTGGAGLVRNNGDGPQATLTGQYTFRLFGTFPIDETDQITITVNQPRSSAMGLLGGGATFALSSTTGLRADIQLMLSAARDVTTVHTAPEVFALSPPIILPTAPGISPGIQFSSQPEVRSSLHGPTGDLTVFRSSGVRANASLTLGIFKRF